MNGHRGSCTHLHKAKFQSYNHFHHDFLSYSAHWAKKLKGAEKHEILHKFACHPCAGVPPGVNLDVLFSGGILIYILQSMGNR